MWNRKKKITDDKREMQLSIIAIATELEGNLSVNDNLKVEGNVKGDIQCFGKLVISTSGVVKGNIQCAQADIYGWVEGNLICQGALQVHPDAVLRGNISTGELDV